MREFFYPANIAVFGVADDPRNLARNIISNLREFGFKGDIYPVGRQPGETHGEKIITDPESLPKHIDLAVILVPALAVAEALDICGRKGIFHVIISTGGFREFNDQDNQYEIDTLRVAKQYGIRFIGPNCLGVICTNSGLCTPFNPLRLKALKRGPVSIIVQSGGVTTQTAYTFSDEYVGFSKIISVGNKLNIDEIDLMKYLVEDEDTEQIHLYLESIEHGKELMTLAKKSEKPFVVFKSNTSNTASQIARSHTAALYNNDLVVDSAMKQAGIIRVKNIHEMTVSAKALRLPPLKGNRLAVISQSGGFAVIYGDICEKYGFQCPPLPRELLDKIEERRRGGVIRMSNPMDTGDIHDVQVIPFIVEQCLALEYIDGVVLSTTYEKEIQKMLRNVILDRTKILNLFRGICERTKKPIALSFLAERREVEMFRENSTFPVFNGPEESVQAMRFLFDYWKNSAVPEKI